MIVVAGFSMDLYAQEKTVDLSSILPGKPEYEFVIGAGVLLDYGPYVGNYNNHKGSVGHRQILPGYCLGIGRHQVLASRIELYARLQLEQKGQKTESFHPYDTSRYSIQRSLDREVLNYLTLSIMTRILIDRNKKISIGIGGYGGILNRARQLTVNYHLTNPFPSGINNAINIYEKYDAGVAIGLGYLIRNNTKYSMSIQLTDNLGLMNIIKPTPGRVPQKTNTVFITFSYVMHRNSANYNR